jgi:hypothetical protein
LLCDPLRGRILRDAYTPEPNPRNGTPHAPQRAWIRVAPPQGQEAGGSQTGICLDTSDVDADHAALKAAGVDVDDEVTRWGGAVPPMFWLRDPGGNALIVVEPTS